MIELTWFEIRVRVDRGLNPSCATEGDVARSVERRTVTLLTQVRFPGAAKDFFFSLSQSQLSVQTLLRCPYTPRVQSHALTSVRALKIL